MTLTWKNSFCDAFQTTIKHLKEKNNSLQHGECRRLWCNEVLCVINYNGAEKAYDFLADSLSLSSAELKCCRNYTCGCELRLIAHWILRTISFPPEKPLKPGKWLALWIPDEMGSCRWCLCSAFWSLSLTQTILFTRNKWQMSQQMWEWGQGKKATV